MNVIPIVPAVLCEHPDGKNYLRSGECNRCGACCRSGNPFVAEQTVPPTPCELLVDHGGGLHSCGDRSSHVYLLGCNVWPSRPEHVVPYPDCSYTFREVTDGGANSLLPPGHDS